MNGTFAETSWTFLSLHRLHADQDDRAVCTQCPIQAEGLASNARRSTELLSRTDDTCLEQLINRAKEGPLISHMIRQDNQAVIWLRAWPGEAQLD